MEEIEQQKIELTYKICIFGDTGVGKTSLAIALSQALKREFIRIQCYEGISFECRNGMTTEKRAKQDRSALQSELSV